MGRSTVTTILQAAMSASETPIFLSLVDPHVFDKIYTLRISSYPFVHQPHWAKIPGPSKTSELHVATNNSPNDDKGLATRVLRESAVNIASRVVSTRNPQAFVIREVYTQRHACFLSYSPDSPTG